MRTRYLLCYDVRDERRLRRTIKVAERWGRRVQYSVFICDLSDIERARLEGDLRVELDVSVDYALLIDLGPAGDSSSRRLHWIAGHQRLTRPGEATII